MGNPFAIEGPAVVSFSGGRSSAYMLSRIVESHGGSLPDDILAVFANTGREHPATLDFVRKMGDICPIVWAEFDLDCDGQYAYRVVDPCSASRNGEPFEKLIDKRRMLPNPVARFCTADLKIRTIARYVKSLGWDEWTDVVGIRADEPRRWARIKSDSNRDIALPMVEDGTTLADVLRYWKGQDFDLELPGNDPAFGNCDLCFLKARPKIEKVMLSIDGASDWWIKQEAKGVGGRASTFRTDRASYAEMQAQVNEQGRLFDDAIEDEIVDCYCGN